MSGVPVDRRGPMLLIPVVALIVGVCLRFSAMVFSGLGTWPLRLVGDGRSIAFRLEHDWRWLTGQAGYQSFWDVPLFHPQPHVAAYTDVMIAVGPFYWPWRVLGAAPDTAFQLFSISISVVNFALCYWLLRRHLRVGVVAASFGAYLLAFNAYRPTFVHVQLAPLFWVLLVAIALFQIAERARESGVRRPMMLWFVVFAVAIVGQLYSSVYTLFFFGLVGGFVAVAALVGSRTRATVVSVVRNHWLAVLTAFMICTAGAAYFLYEFSLAERVEEQRAFRPLRTLPLIHWLLPSRDAFLTGWVHAGYMKPGAAVYYAKHAAGPGLVAAGLVAFGLFRRRRETAVRLLLIGTAGLVVISCSVGGASLWRYVHDYVPGADALRAQARGGGTLVLLVALGGAFGAETLLVARRRIAVGVLLLVAMAEQVVPPRESLDKSVLREHIRSLAARVDREKEAFVLVSTEAWYEQASRDAAWVALETGVPTVNGRYGNFPPGWLLRGRHGDVVVEDDEDRRHLRASLQAWCRQTGLDFDRVQWIEYSPRALIPLSMGGTIRGR